MANATLRERQTQYKSCPQELYKLNAQQLKKIPNFVNLFFSSLCPLRLCGSFLFKFGASLYRISITYLLLFYNSKGEINSRIDKFSRFRNLMLPTFLGFTFHH